MEQFLLVGDRFSSINSRLAGVALLSTTTKLAGGCVCGAGFVLLDSVGLLLLVSSIFETLHAQKEVFKDGGTTGGLNDLSARVALEAFSVVSSFLEGHGFCRVHGLVALHALVSTPTEFGRSGRASRLGGSLGSSGNLLLSVASVSKALGAEELLLEHCCSTWGDFLHAVGALEALSMIRLLLVRDGFSCIDSLVANSAFLSTTTKFAGACRTGVARGGPNDVLLLLAEASFLEAVPERNFTTKKQQRTYLQYNTPS